MNRQLRLIALIGILVSCGNEPEEKDEVTTALKQIESPAASAASAEPYLFTDAQGRVYLSWIEKEDAKSQLKFSMLQEGAWSTPKLIAEGDDWFVNWADFPMLATDGNQKMIAHFLQKSGKSTYAYDVMMVSSSDLGNTWTKRGILHDDGKQAEHGFVSICPYQQGFFISWLDGRNTAGENEEGHGGHDGHHGQMTLRAAILGSDGKKLKEWELDNRVCDCCQTSAAITANGPVVVYRDRSEDEIRDISIVRWVGDRWSDPVTVYKDNWKIDGCPVNGPQVSAQGNNLAVAWFSSPDKKSAVHVAFSSDAGVSFAKPVRIDESKSIGRVDVSMLDDSTAMVSWMEGSQIKAVKVNANGSKQSPITIASSSESRSSGFPQMTKAGNRLIFAWTDDKEKRVRVASLPAGS